MFSRDPRQTIEYSNLRVLMETHRRLPPKEPDGAQSLLHMYCQWSWCRSFPNLESSGGCDWVYMFIGSIPSAEHIERVRWSKSLYTYNVLYIFPYLSTFKPRKSLVNTHCFPRHKECWLLLVLYIIDESQAYDKLLAERLSPGEATAVSMTSYSQKDAHWYR